VDFTACFTVTGYPTGHVRYTTRRYPKKIEENP
jgi:hypothetical protein